MCRTLNKSIGLEFITLKIVMDFNTNKAEWRQSHNHVLPDLL